ncbi:MAG TPA: hypothetical protein VN031_01720 [Candidatus Microsaccharimonas sp.]|nr:hypothetical protein [Candidatus Microsaccharimonas sp.]
MSLFSKPNAIVYVRRGGLVVAGKKIAPARLTFAPEQVRDLEVLRDESFTENLRDFFTEHGLKGKHVLMVLDDSVVFTKSVALDEDGQPGAIADAFIDQMPFSPGKRACLRFSQDSKLNIYATNGQLYLAIAEALDQAGAAKLLAITPAAAYPSDGSKQQLAAAIQQYINDTSVRANANFQNAALL